MHHRKSLRLNNYDYAQSGFYFITICTKDKENVFGYVQDDKIIMNLNGTIVEECWYDLENHYPNCKLHEFVIMPNHFHGIIQIVGKGLQPFHCKSYPLFEIIRGFKTFSSKKINNQFGDTDSKFEWQKSFYDRVIRTEKELHKIREYIVNNPVKWELDSYYAK